MEAKKLKRNALFNPSGDTEIRLRKMIGGNTTNLNDFNNMRYKWVSDWYRQAMNNFWIPEEINLTQDTKDYPLLDEAERTAYDKILRRYFFLINAHPFSIGKECHCVSPDYRLYRAYSCNSDCAHIPEKPGCAGSRYKTGKQYPAV